MSTRTVTIVDDHHHHVATAEVTLADGVWAGTLVSGPLPEPYHSLFLEFESLVDGQVLALLDAVEERIAATGLTIVSDDGVAAPIRDVQIFPTSGGVSFAVRVPVDFGASLDHSRA